MNTWLVSPKTMVRIDRVSGPQGRGVSGRTRRVFSKHAGSLMKKKTKRTRISNAYLFTEAEASKTLLHRIIWP